MLIANAYRALAALLAYPETALIGALDEIETELDARVREKLAPLFGHLRGESLVRLQEIYVDTFDRKPAHSLHLFEHIHGESRDRGQAMVDLLDEYRHAGFEPDSTELPDYVPALIELLSVLYEAQRSFILDDAVHVLAALGERLARAGSPYAVIFELLVAESRVAPKPLESAPGRDMDEAMEIFGPAPDGVEPLLKPAADIVRFYPDKTSAGVPSRRSI